MQLCEIPVSIFMQIPPNSLYTELKETIDPEYYSDLKNHLNNNPDYRKARIEWRKKNPQFKTLFQVREEFFKHYKETDLQTFHRDIFYFVLNNPDISSDEGAKMFCSKWKGYEKTYGVEFTRRAIERCQNNGN